jgi:hypothetical protein
LLISTLLFVSGCKERMIGCEEYKEKVLSNGLSCTEIEPNLVAGGFLTREERKDVIGLKQ